MKTDISDNNSIEKSRQLTYELLDNSSEKKGVHVDLLNDKMSGNLREVGVEVTVVK